MEIRVEQIGDQETEYIEIGCHVRDARVNELVRKLQLWQGRVEAFREERQYQIAIADIYYIEAVDERTFLYLEKDCYESRKRLYELEALLEERGFVRISKSVIVDLMKVTAIRPALNGRFLCRLRNGEDVIISRKYVPAVKAILRGEKGGGL